MADQLESAPVRFRPRRGLIRRWLIVLLLLALTWNFRDAVKDVPAAIRSLVRSSDAVQSPPPARPIQAQAQPAVAVPEPATPDTQVTASSKVTAPPKPSVRAEESRAEPSVGSTIPHSEGDRPPGYSVQVAAVPDAGEARTLSDQLTRAGYSVYLTTATVNQVRFHRVRVGPFQTRQTAQEAARRLETQGYKAPWITK
jgi:DedD protein